MAKRKSSVPRCAICSSVSSAHIFLPEGLGIWCLEHHDFCCNGDDWGVSPDGKTGEMFDGKYMISFDFDAKVFAEEKGNKVLKSFPGKTIYEWQILRQDGSSPIGAAEILADVMFKRAYLEGEAVDVKEMEMLEWEARCAKFCSA